MSNTSLPAEVETKVQETADDAAVSKLSAVTHGYVRDPFMALFVRKYLRRSPLINRGYFARMAGVEAILKRFVAICRASKAARSQIVSLGAGFDTSFFKLCGANSAPAIYYEVDFPDVTARKSSIIKKHKVLLDAIAGRPVVLPEGSAAFPASDHEVKLEEYPEITITPNKVGGCNVTAEVYKLLTADLRDVASLQAVLTAHGIDFSCPTLFLSECVLVYLEPEQSCAIIAWAAERFSRSVFVTYEQIRPHDAFGQIMARNLEDRGYKLRGLHAFPDIAAQTARYKELGYQYCTVCDMNDVYYRILPRENVARVEKLELFDEVEEWHLMSAHYCIAVAVNERTPIDSTAAEATESVSKRARVASVDTSPCVAKAAEIVATHSLAAQQAHPSPGGKLSSSSSEVQQAAFAMASGTHVTSVDISPTPRTPSGESPHIERICTDGGEVVVTGAHVDFGAIAEAEREMMHAKHTREEVGVDRLLTPRDKHVRAVAATTTSVKRDTVVSYSSDVSSASMVDLRGMLFPVTSS